jgi:hypothetical protein
MVRQVDVARWRQRRHDAGARGLGTQQHQRGRYQRRVPDAARVEAATCNQCRSHLQAAGTFGGLSILSMNFWERMHGQVR